MCIIVMDRLHDYRMHFSIAIYSIKLRKTRIYRVSRLAGGLTDPMTDKLFDYSTFEKKNPMFEEEGL